MKECGKCRRELPLTAFNKNKSRADGLHGDCRECKKKYQAEWYRRHSDEHKQRTRTRASRETPKTRAWMDELKSQPCTDCGQTYPPYVMDWDHLPGTDKKTHVGGMTSNSRETILAEIAKCELVCANCHRIRTFTRLRS